MTINTNNTQVAPPGLGSSGGVGGRAILWSGTPTSHPLLLGHRHRESKKQKVWGEASRASHSLP